MCLCDFLFRYLDYEDKKKPAKMSTEDKKAAIKQLIDLIPTEKSQLFAWKMDWDQVDQVNYWLKLEQIHGFGPNQCSIN